MQIATDVQVAEVFVVVVLEWNCVGSRHANLLCVFEGFACVKSRWNKAIHQVHGSSSNVQFGCCLTSLLDKHDALVRLVVESLVTNLINITVVSRPGAQHIDIKQ